MSVQINTSVVGLDELEKAVKDLMQEMTRRGETAPNLIKNALNAVGRDVKNRMVQAAPESAAGSHVDWHKSKNGKWVHGGLNGKRASPGRLKRSIFSKVERNPRRVSEAVYVGPRMGKDRNDESGAWYAAIVEMHGGDGGKGKGFMRNSILPEHHSAMFGVKLAQGLDRAAKKIGADNARAIAAKYKK